MFHPELQAALARERQAWVLAEARTARVARQARQARSHRWPGRRRSAPADGRQVLLRDGSQVLIRPVHSTDAPLLADGFSRLSAESRWRRFLMAKKDLSPAELRYLTDIDHHDHEALGALDREDGRGVGVARFVRHPQDPGTAEIAVTVVDDWQRRGLGTELLTQLTARACQEGISRFTALVAADNAAMAGLLHNLSADLVHHELGTLTYELALACPVNSY
jgi:RimJ/RimL family protein N-acetyltransferase